MLIPVNSHHHHMATTLEKGAGAESPSLRAMTGAQLVEYLEAPWLEQGYGPLGTKNIHLT